VGVGIHAYIAQVNQPMRLPQAELEAHPAWKNFGVEYGRRSPMRAWLAVRLIGSDGLNCGLIQVSDCYASEFTAEDEANMTRLARLTAQALDALAMVYFPDYRDQWARLSANDLG
jgi:GAF domain-containing protein